MKIALLAICFYRHDEIEASLTNILDNILPETNINLGLLEIQTPNSEKIQYMLKNLKTLKNINKHIFTFSINSVSSAILTATFKTNILDDCDYVAVTETDIRLLTKGTIEECCKNLDDNIICMSPEYDISSDFHKKMYKQWIRKRMPYNEINITSAQGFQLLVFKKNIWIEYCNNIITKNLTINDVLLSIWIQQYNKYIGISKNYKMIHTGWDVYDTPSSDQDYLNYKNALIKNNDLWKPLNMIGNEFINFTILD